MAELDRRGAARGGWWGKRDAKDSRLPFSLPLSGSGPGKASRASGRGRHPWQPHFGVCAALPSTGHAAVSLHEACTAVAWPASTIDAR